MTPRSAGNTDDPASESPSNSVTHSTVDATAVTCDQAIFTSVRTPMGEGYRIIAASRGVTAAEKQAITKTSPSHDSLIDTGPDATGLASYLLPTGRLCIAKFWCAGAEQSGRGGKRVYTHNIVMTSDDLSRFAFSVFAVIRSAEDCGVFTGALEPEKVLPRLSLPGDPVVSTTFADPAELSRCASHVVEKLLDNRKIVLQVSGDPLAAARCLVAALPGPMRCEISFAAGLRFALSRSLRLNVTCRDHGVTMRRVQGQPIDLFASDDAATPTPDDAAARPRTPCLNISTSAPPGMVLRTISCTRRIATAGAITCSSPSVTRAVTLPSVPICIAARISAGITTRPPVPTTSWELAVERGRSETVLPSSGRQLISS